MTASPYLPSLADAQFALAEIGRLRDICALPVYADITPDLTQAILSEAGKFATDVLSPLNGSGDRAGCIRAADGSVATAQGFKEAYQQFVQSGWNSAPIAASFGGQGLPLSVSTLVAEMWHGANMSFGLCPMLTQSAIELIAHHASPTLKAVYLPKLISGEWCGTMCMTEPQAGSDVGAVRSRAVPQGEHYRIHGTKIFITYGEHDLSSNIIHMVLARLPDAPAGTKGLSLFLVPKFLPDASGAPTTRNDLICVSLEHKMGINASPTCVMSFGDNEGAVGWLVGEAGGGIKAMFTMMNSARFAVGLEGIGIMGYAHQLAATYAAERTQTGKPIAQYGDVGRMLHTMRAHSEAMRALAVYTAHHMDVARHHADAAQRERAQDRIDLLIPILKAHGTQMGFDMASLAMQVHGGIGYVEETGISQLMRDVRVAMIYEGTNGIQALDLSHRKIQLHDGRLYSAWHAELVEHASRLRQHISENIVGLSRAFEASVDMLSTATAHMQRLFQAERSEALQMAAHEYLTLSALIAEAYMLTHSALIASDQLAAHISAYDTKFLEEKILTAQFFTRHLLVATDMHCTRIVQTL